MGMDRELLSHRFEMLMGFADAMEFNLNIGTSASFGLRLHDTDLANPERQLFDWLVFAISLGLVDVRGMAVSTYERDKDGFCSYVSQLECEFHEKVFRYITLAWANAGDNIVKRLHIMLGRQQNVNDLAIEAGIDSIVHAINMGVPPEDAVV